MCAASNYKRENHRSISHSKIDSWLVSNHNCTRLKHIRYAVPHDTIDYLEEDLLLVLLFSL